MRMVLISLTTVFGISGCSLQKAIPSGYIECEEHFEDGFMDYTDYCKYYYKEGSEDIFAAHKGYEKVKEEETQNIRGYFDHCGSMMKAQERGAEFDFDPQCITVGDYVYIETKEGEQLGEQDRYEKYDAYSVYLYDRESHTLYYVHNNN